MNNMEKTGLYIHIPFCIRKCAYCDFVSYEGISCEKKEQYISACIEDMKEYRGTEIDTIYFGGGTPTTLDIKHFAELFRGINENFKVCENAEITVECNPKTADFEYFKELKSLGCNRLSIGVQSLNDSELSYLGRVHGRDEAIFCVEQAKNAGFENFSVDVMFGLSGQTLYDVKRTLDGLTELSPAHISCYSLIIEPGTPFFEKKIEPLSEDDERKMQWFIVDYLKDKGFDRYEISNFAKDGMISRHNSKYWNMIPYIGVGATASSFFDGCRYEKNSDIDEYIQNPRHKLNFIRLSKEDEMSEFMFLGLRKASGVSFSEFYEKFSISIEEKYDIKKHINLGLLIKDGDRLYLSERGIDVSNAILCDFV